MPKRSSIKRPRDANLLASSIVSDATSDEKHEVKHVPPKNPHAVALGREGGKKGGPARAAMLSSKRRHEIAKKAALARYGKK
jgi:hypothetical protein